MTALRVVGGNGAAAVEALIARHEPVGDLPRVPDPDVLELLGHKPGDR